MLNLCGVHCSPQTMRKRMDPIFADMLNDDPLLTGCLPEVEQAYDMLLTCVRTGGKILICGNGGSAADSEHIVGELMKGFRQTRPLSSDLRNQFVDLYGEEGTYLADHLQGAIPAISLVSHTALITAFLNDVDASMIFAQQVLGYGKAGDCLIGISTSGNAANVVRAVEVAHVLGVRSIGMTNSHGGRLKEMCDVCICAPATETAKAQQHHEVIYHALCSAVEAAIFSIK